MTSVKKLVGTEDFLSMPDKTKKCKVENHEDCRRRRGENELEIPSWPLKAQKGMKAEGRESFLESNKCAG